MLEIATKTGAWTGFSTKMSNEVREIFDEALAGLIGVSYRPVAVATEVGAGINYCFFCNAVGIYPGAVKQGAMVNIHQSADGVVKLIEIRLLDIGGCKSHT